MFGLFKKKMKVPTTNAKKSKEQPYFPTAIEIRERTEQKVKVWSTEEIRQEIVSAKKIRWILLDGKLTVDAYNILKEKGYDVKTVYDDISVGAPFFIIKW